jgi:hypothetical protein
MQVQIKIRIIVEFRINHVLLYNELGKLQYFHKIFKKTGLTLLLLQMNFNRT